MNSNKSFRLVGLSAALAFFALGLAPAYGQSPVFTKSLKKLNGVTVANPPASLTNGDTIDWVMTYRFDHTPANPAQTNIQDLLPPTLQYVAGSLQVPPSWAKQWFNGSVWATAEPASVSGVGATVLFPSVSPFGAGVTSPLPAPPTVSINTATAGGGDGYRAIPYQDQVYVINHHTPTQYLKCFEVATGKPCAGYPAHVPVTNGTTYIGNANGDNTTSGKTSEYLDRVNGKLYFPVFKLPNELGILCANLKTMASCGFVPLSSSGTDYQDISGIGGINGKIYVQLRGGMIGCVDTTGPVPIACTGQPYPVLAGYNNNVPYSSSEIVGAKIYSIWSTSSTTQPFQLSCFDTAVPSLCNWGGNPKTPDATGTSGILYPLSDVAGTVTGICAHTTSAGSAAFNCYDLSTGALIPSSGASLPNPSNYLAWVQIFGGGWYQNVGFGQSTHYKSRVFNGSYNTAAPGAGAMGCYDFAASPPGPCGEASWPLTGAAVPLKHYATIADPERPGCMWSYGDDGRLLSFEAANGKSCATSTTLDTIVMPAQSYCAGGTVTGWDKLSMTGLTLGGGITATLSIYDGSNPQNLALTSTGTPYAQNLVVSSLPLTLGAGGLGIGYGTGPGQYRSLRIVLTLAGIADTSPWSNTPPPSVEVTWLGDAPQFCFQTKVVSCASQFVTNQATAVTTPSSGAPFTQVAPNPPFSATHVLGAGCPSSCLEVSNETILCAADGSGDYLYSFQVTNNSTIPAYHLLLLDLPAPAVATPNDVTFVPEGGFLAPGKMSQVKTVRIHGAHAGNFTFRVGLFDQKLAQCCAAIPHAIVLPACDCAQVLADFACNPFFHSSTFQYTFTIQNLTTAPPISYALVTTTTPGLLITQGGAPLVPPLRYGGKTTETVNFSGPAATNGATVCFNLSVHDSTLLRCCSINRCVMLNPTCDVLEPASPDLNISLSTGVAAAAPQQTDPSGEQQQSSQADPNWTVNVPKPAGPAQAVLSPDSDWPWAVPGTAWISRDPSAASVPGVSATRYRRCFCIGTGAHQATLDASLWADDRASLLLNGVPIAGPGGHYSDAKPMTVHLTGAVGKGGPFAVGTNCLVAVVHGSGDTTGLDLFGSVQAAGGACTP